MSLDSARDIAAVHEAVEPWLRITTYTQARGLGLGAEGPYEFATEVKVDPEAPLEAELASAAAAREVRSHLLGRAEDALDALLAADWHLTSAPRMDFTGRLTRSGLDDDGRPLVPTFHHDILLRLWFEVDRPRPLRVRLTAPEAVADEIFATWARGERPWNG
jgi:hypothetical protein